MIKMNTVDLIALNELVQISTALKMDRINKYVLQLKEKEKTIIVEIYQQSGKFGVLLRKDIEGIEEDEIIPIVDAFKLGEWLTKIVDSKKIKISVKKNTVLFETKKDKLKLPFFEETDKEIASRNKIRSSFKTLKYGEENNNLVYYKLEDPEDPDPDAICKVDLKKLKLKNISNIFEINYVTLKAGNGKFSIVGKEKTGIEIEKTIFKEQKDAMSVKGKCEILLQDIDCITMLSKFGGMTIIKMKQAFPLVLIKKLPENRIGVNYLISIMEDMDDEPEKEE